MRSLPRAFYAAVALAALHVGSGYIYDTTYTTGGLIESAYELSEVSGLLQGWVMRSSLHR